MQSSNHRGSTCVRLRTRDTDKLDQIPTPVANLKIEMKYSLCSLVTWHDKMADADERGHVQSILAAQKEKYKSVQVHKDIGVNYDVGNLMVSDVNLLDYDALK